MGQHLLTSKPTPVPPVVRVLRDGINRGALLARANAWAKRSGYKPVTSASLLEWRQQGLVPAPRGRSLGRGKGSVQSWSGLAYRRVLQIMECRKSGIHRRREQRLTLWLNGADISLSLIRRDLHSYLKELLEAVRWEFLRDGNGLDQTSSLEGNRTLRRLTSVGGARRFIEKRGLPLEGPAWMFVRECLKRPETGDLLRLAGLTLFYRTGSADGALGGLTSLPTGMRQLFSDDRQLRAWKGLLSDPDVRPHPLLDRLDAATDRTLLNLRDFARGSNELWQVGLQTLESMVKDQPELVEPLGPWSVAIPGLLRWLATVRPMNSLELKIGLVALLLARLENPMDEAQPFGEAGRSGAKALRGIVRERRHASVQGQ